MLLMIDPPAGPMVKVAVDATVVAGNGITVAEMGDRCLTPLTASLKPPVSKKLGTPGWKRAMKYATSRQEVASKIPSPESAPKPRHDYAAEIQLVVSTKHRHTGCLTDHFHGCLCYEAVNPDIAAVFNLK